MIEFDPENRQEVYLLYRVSKGYLVSIDMVVHVYKPRTWEKESGTSLKV